jgi:hypothetical protein
MKQAYEPENRPCGAFIKRCLSLTQGVTESTDMGHMNMCSKTKAGEGLTVHEGGSRSQFPLSLESGISAFFLGVLSS